MRAGDTHERWHPGESDDYLRAAIARVSGGDMSDLRTEIADIITDATDERHDRTVRGDYDPIDDGPYVTRILDAVAKALTSKAVVRAAGRAIPTDPNFGANTWPDDARVCITAALTEAGITPEDAPRTTVTYRLRPSMPDDMLTEDNTYTTTGEDGER